jgi:acylpyruvate hydrolase
MSAPRLARVRTADGPRVVVRSAPDAWLATVDGAVFADLPELLRAAGGDAGRIARGTSVSIDERNLLSAVGRPAKVVGIGLNYRGHAAEIGAAIPAHPMVFAKWDGALTGPYADIPLPPESSMVDWEAELAFVFGRPARRVTPEGASDVVFGYTIANDVSMRDFQRHTSQYGAGKSWPSATPLGPEVVPIADCGGIDPDLRIVGALDGRVVQDERTTDLIFSIRRLVAYLTTIMEMAPGDVVLTGTPAGVGAAAQPARFLADGEVFEVRVEGLGAIRNRFVDEDTECSVQ